MHNILHSKHFLAHIKKIRLFHIKLWFLILSVKRISSGNTRPCSMATIGWTQIVGAPFKSDQCPLIYHSPLYLTWSYSLPVSLITLVGTLVCNPWHNGKSSALGAGDLDTSSDAKILQRCWVSLLGSLDLGSFVNERQYCLTMWKCLEQLIYSLIYLFS